MGDPDSGRWQAPDRRAPWRADGGASHHHANAPTSDGSGGLTGGSPGRSIPARARGGDPDSVVLGAGLVRRKAPLDRLSATSPGGVILVCAAAGSGKTVLVRSWIGAAGLEDRIAWVSVERGERDAQRFWLAVIAALADAGGIVQRVDPAPSFRGEAVVEKLLDNLDSLEEPAALVIDDLHELRSSEALRWLEVFLAALPSKLRVVLVSS